MQKLFFLLLIFSCLCRAEQPVVLIVGTRPEAIKMFPVYEALKKENIPTVLCSTGQHAELLNDALEIFDLKPDFDLKIMKPGQDLFHITETVLEKTHKLFEELKPALVVVQGDTTSAMSAALSAFYLKIPVAHVEAGLRSGNMHAPFPEEMNRRLITLLGAYHFAPTELSASQLLKEGVDPAIIFCTGNTCVDALFSIRSKIQEGKLRASLFLSELIQKHKEQGHRILLLTAHRRESFDGGLQNIMSALKMALTAYPNLHVIYPRHPNPAILKILQESGLDSFSNISVLPPLPYNDMVYLLCQADGVATDSGGIQEEAVSLNKPVLVLRNETDRPEALFGGGAILVGTETEVIFKEIQNLMDNHFSSPCKVSIYGDGHAGERIANIIKVLFAEKSLQD